MFYGLSNFANNWVAAAGPEQIMYVFGGTSIFLSLLAGPVYIFGKRLRCWWSRHDLFVVLKIEVGTLFLRALFSLLLYLVSCLLLVVKNS